MPAWPSVLSQEDPGIYILPLDNCTLTFGVSTKQGNRCDNQQTNLIEEETNTQEESFASEPKCYSVTETGLESLGR